MRPFIKYWDWSFVMRWSGYSLAYLQVSWARKKNGAMQVFVCEAAWAKLPMRQEFFCLQPTRIMIGLFLSVISLTQWKGRDLRVRCLLRLSINSLVFLIMLTAHYSLWIFHLRLSRWSCSFPSVFLYHAGRILAVKVTVHEHWAERLT